MYSLLIITSSKCGCNLGIMPVKLDMGLSGNPVGVEVLLSPVPSLPTMRLYGSCLLLLVVGARVDLDMVIF